MAEDIEIDEPTYSSGWMAAGLNNPLEEVQLQVMVRGFPKTRGGSFSVFLKLLPADSEEEVIREWWVREAPHGWEVVAGPANAEDLEKAVELVWAEALERAIEDEQMRAERKLEGEWLEEDEEEG